MIDPIVTILVALAVSVVIGTVLGFAASPILAIGGVVINKINNLSIHQRWMDYWADWEMRHRDD